MAYGTTPYPINPLAQLAEALVQGYGAFQQAKDMTRQRELQDLQRQQTEMDLENARTQQVYQDQDRARATIKMMQENGTFWLMSPENQAKMLADAGYSVPITSQTVTINGQAVNPQELSPVDVNRVQVNSQYGLPEKPNEFKKVSELTPEEREAWGLTDKKYQNMNFGDAQKARQLELDEYYRNQDLLLRQGELDLARQNAANKKEGLVKGNVIWTPEKMQQKLDEEAQMWGIINTVESMTPEERNGYFIQNPDAKVQYNTAKTWVRTYDTGLLNEFRNYLGMPLQPLGRSMFAGTKSGPEQGGKDTRTQDERTARTMAMWEYVKTIKKNNIDDPEVYAQAVQEDIQTGLFGELGYADRKMLENQFGIEIIGTGIGARVRAKNPKSKKPSQPKQGNKGPVMFAAGIKPPL